MEIYQGLKIIARKKLPHPEWEFVKSGQDLEKFYKIEDYAGWTIRTVRITGGLYKNLYINRLKKSLVPKKIESFQKKLRGKALFVVYPSWYWKKGGTLLLEKGRVIIEAVKGEVEDLVRRGKIDLRLIFQKERKVEVFGQNFLTKREKKILLGAAKKIKRRGLILEWAVTNQNKFIFYKIEDIKTAARLLIKKYGRNT